MCKYRNVTLKFKTVRVTTKMKRKSLPTVREEKRSVCNSDAVMYGIVMLTAVLSYANSLSGEFVHDDIPAIVTNGDVTGGSPLKDLFVNDFWGTPMADVNSHKSYRPLTTLTFRLNFALAGLRPWWWHICNVALHTACCVLVARACVTVARLQRPFATLAALLFAVHPIHTEAVAGVVGRADVLACIFFLSSLLVYHRPSSSKKRVGLSIALGALSMLAKETGVTILLLNIAFDTYRCWPFVRRSMSSLKLHKRSTRLFMRAIKVFGSLGLLISIRLALLQGSLPTFSPQDNPAAFNPDFFVRLMTFCYLAAFNWWLLLCPWSLSHDWQMGSVPLVTSGWDPRNLVTCAAFGALLLLCYRCIADMEVQRHIPAVLGVLLLVIPFVPATNLFLTVGFVIAERVLYIPSVGSVIITAYGVQLMWYSRPGTKFLLVTGLVILAVSGVARTHRRNADWRDRETLLKADLVTLPQNAKLQYNFGNFLRESEMQDLAIKHYKEALRLWPTYASAHNNIGTLLTGIEITKYHFLQAIKFNRHHVNAHFNLGKLYKRTGKFQEAVQMFERCISLQPLFVQAHMELIPLREDEERSEQMRRLISLEPNRWEHRIYYGDWLRAQGLPGPASQFYLQAVRLSFSHGIATFRSDIVAVRLTALMYRKMGQKSRILQLLTRWHTWRRGWPSPGAALYLQGWHLKRELRKKEELYSKASANPTDEIDHMKKYLLQKSTTCVDHSQLSMDPKSPFTDTGQTDATNLISENNKDIAIKCNEKFCTCGLPQHMLSVLKQLKNKHNKSEVGRKNKQCSLKKKKDKARNTVTFSASLVEPVIFKMV